MPKSLRKTAASPAKRSASTLTQELTRPSRRQRSVTGTAPVVAKISRNHTEVEYVLPPEAVVVQALEFELAKRKTVSYANMLNFYDDVLAALDVDPPEALYPYVVARVHSTACLTSRKCRWDEKGRQWVYTVETKHFEVAEQD